MFAGACADNLENASNLDGKLHLVEHVCLEWEYGIKHLRSLNNDHSANQVLPIHLIKRERGQGTDGAYQDCLRGRPRMGSE